MGNVRDRVSAIRAGTVMAAPGSGTYQGSAGMGPSGSMVSGSVSGQASIQATGLLIVVLVVVCVLGERLGR